MPVVRPSGRAARSPFSGPWPLVPSQAPCGVGSVERQWNGSGNVGGYDGRSWWDRICSIGRNMYSRARTFCSWTGYGLRDVISKTVILKLREAEQCIISRYQKCGRTRTSQHMYDGEVECIETLSNTKRYSTHNHINSSKEPRRISIRTAETHAYRPEKQKTAHKSKPKDKGRANVPVIVRQVPNERRNLKTHIRTTVPPASVLSVVWRCDLGDL